MIDLKSFIGKENDYLEKELGFTHYIELKDRLSSGKDQDHEDMIKSLLEFISGQELKVVKTDDGVIVEIFDMHLKEVVSNLELLKNKKGVFWEEETEMCFALLGDNFFSYVFPNMIMFSANEENTSRMADLLQKYDLDFFGPELIGRYDHVNTGHKKVKLGKNEPCHCGSGKKYKKCCLNGDIEKYGHAIKI